MISFILYNATYKYRQISISIVRTWIIIKYYVLIMLMMIIMLIIMMIMAIVKIMTILTIITIIHPTRSDFGNLTSKKWMDTASVFDQSLMTEMCRLIDK